MPRPFPANPASPANAPASPPPSSRPAFLHGLRRGAVLAPSFAPFALVCGMGAVQAGLGEAGAIGMATLTFAGSSQAVFTQYLNDGAPLWVAILSGLVLNLRMAVYSADLSTRLGPTTRLQRVLWAAFLVDQTHLLLQELRASGLHKGQEFAFHLGSAAALWPAWILFNTVGALLGARIPPAWELDFAVPLSFVVMVVPSLRSLPVLAAALIGGAAGLLLLGLPLRLGLVAAGLLGALGATALELTLRRRALTAPRDGSR